MDKTDYKQWEPTLTPLPCPFCGEIPWILPENPMEEGDAGGSVECKNEHCFVRPAVDDGEEICDIRGPGAYKDIAIKRWNKRAYSQPLNATDSKACPLYVDYRKSCKALQDRKAELAATD